MTREDVKTWLLAGFFIVNFILFPIHCINLISSNLDHSEVLYSQKEEIRKLRHDVYNHIHPDRNGYVVNKAVIK